MAESILGSFCFFGTRYFFAMSVSYLFKPAKHFRTKMIRSPRSRPGQFMLGHLSCPKIASMENNGFVIETSWTLFEACCIAVWRWEGEWNSFSAVLVVPMMQFHLHIFWLTGQLAVLNLVKACAGLLFVHGRYTISESWKNMAFRRATLPILVVVR